MHREVVVDIRPIFRRIQPHPEHPPGFRRIRPPRRHSPIHEKREKIIPEFAKRRLRDIQQFERRLRRSRQPLAPLGDVLDPRPPRLRHLVELPPARIALSRQKPPAERQRFELDEVREDVHIQPLVPRGRQENGQRRVFVRVHAPTMPHAKANSKQKERQFLNAFFPTAVDCPRLPSTAIDPLSPPPSPPPHPPFDTPARARIS